MTLMRYGLGDGLDLTEEDDAILDDIWDKIAITDPPPSPVARSADRVDVTEDDLEEPSLLTFVVRSVEDSLGLYRSTLTDLVERVVTTGGVRSVASTMRSLIIGMADQTYAEGMKQGGIADAEDHMDASDHNAINTWVAGQVPYISGFLSAVAESGQSGEVLNRIEMWVNALAALAHQGLASAKANMMVTWNYGGTEEHCDTCASLNGARHRMSWFVGRGLIPREPGSETLECQGYKCDCRLVDDSGAQVI